MPQPLKNMAEEGMGPLLLAWINFNNPNMDK